MRDLLTAGVGNVGKIDARHKRGRNNKIKKLNLERELRPGSAW